MNATVRTNHGTFTGRAAARPGSTAALLQRDLTDRLMDVAVEGRRVPLAPREQHSTHVRALLESGAARTFIDRDDAGRPEVWLEATR